MDKAHLAASKTTNIYEAIAQISRRAEQINETLRAEINDKLVDFEVVTDSLEEVFENKEQIEMSRQYEVLPKPHAMAVREWLDGKVFYRYPETDSDKA
jgi:DNA-directed RNA polymerase subunit K/omega